MKCTGVGAPRRVDIVRHLDDCLLKLALPQIVVGNLLIREQQLRDLLALPLLVGLLGGGTHPGPGEISLAHNGVLFLDELPEYRRSTLEVLRQPLEDGRVTISRAAGTYNFSSKFLLVCALNPCPCGFFGDPVRQCRCSPRQVESYRAKISGPLLDRIDLHVEVPQIDYKQLSSSEQSEPSATVRSRVSSCRSLQGDRFEGIPEVRTNSDMGPKVMRQHCVVSAECSLLLEQAMSAKPMFSRY